MDTTTTTPEDRAWFAEEVTVQVEQDNRAWLDTLLEMNQLELINFGVYQYGIPEAAAKVVNRNELISMIATANRAGGGQSVGQVQYFYIPELKGVLEPMVSLFKADDDPLFMTRGDGASKQVFNKQTGEWVNLDRLVKQHAAEVATQLQAATNAAAAVSNHPSFQGQALPPSPAPAPRTLLPVLSDATIKMLEESTPKRDILNEFAAELNVEGAEDRENVSNKDLISRIVKANDENKLANQEG